MLDAVEQLPLAHLHVNHRSAGSEPCPPAMMLALLIYCHATGRFGSRSATGVKVRRVANGDENRSFSVDRPADFA